MSDQEEDASINGGASSDDDRSTSNEMVASAPILYTTPAYFRQTRKRGKILKTVSERYLRDDMGFGCYYVDDRQISDG